MHSWRTEQTASVTTCVNMAFSRGDKVGIYCRNVIEAIEAMVAVFKIRAVMVNINYRYVENELQYIFDNSDMVALIHERRYSDKVANVLPNTPKVKSVIVVEDRHRSGLPVLSASATRTHSRRVRVSVISKSAATTTSSCSTPAAPPEVPRASCGVTRTVACSRRRHQLRHRVPVEDEYEMAKVGAANPSMIRYPIPPMIHGGSQSAVFHSSSAAEPVDAPEFDAHEVWQNIDKPRST